MIYPCSRFIGRGVTVPPPLPLGNPQPSGMLIEILPSLSFTILACSLDARALTALTMSMKLWEEAPCKMGKTDQPPPPPPPRAPKPKKKKQRKKKKKKTMKRNVIQKNAKKKKAKK